MKKIILIVIVSMGVLTSCIDHPESRRNYQKDSLSQFRRRVVRRVNGFVKIPVLVDTIFQVGDTIELNNSTVVILK